MKVNVIPWFFEPTDEFSKVIGNRSYREIMFDLDIAKYIESHSVLFLSLIHISEPTRH